MIDRLSSLALLFLAASLPQTALADPLGVDRSAVQSTSVGVSREGDSVATEARRWGLSVKEWATYEEIMRGQGRFFWRDTDPITVLGIYAETETDRTRYAEMLARQEYDLQKRFLALNEAYLAAASRLVGDEPVLDMAKFNRFYNRGPVSTGFAASDGRGTFGQASGNRIVLFVSPDCTGCVDYYRRIRRAQSFGVSLDIYFVAATQKQIIAWAKSAGIDPSLVNQGVITLNRDRGNYARYGKPSLPVAYYYDARSGEVVLMGEEGAQ